MTTEEELEERFLDLVQWIEANGLQSDPDVQKAMDKLMKARVKRQQIVQKKRQKRSKK